MSSGLEPRHALRALHVHEGPMRASGLMLALKDSHLHWQDSRLACTQCQGGGNAYTLWALASACGPGKVSAGIANLAQYALNHEKGLHSFDRVDWPKLRRLVERALSKGFRWLAQMDNVWRVRKQPIGSNSHSTTLQLRS